MFKKKKNRKVSVKKMQGWLDKQKVELVVELLTTGDYQTRMDAIEFLSQINMANVKRELVKCLEDSVEGVAFKAAEKLEYMGVTPDERAEIAKCRKKWSDNSPKMIKEDKGFRPEKSVSK